MVKYRQKHAIDFFGGLYGSSNYFPYIEYAIPPYKVLGLVLEIIEGYDQT